MVKLAEALALRADMQKRLGQLSGRIVRHARHQEGEAPEEDSTELLAEYDRLAVELEALIVRINEQNLRTGIEPGLTMTAALARRDRLRQLHRIRTDLADSGAQGQDRYSRTEIKSVASVNVRSLRAEADALAQEARELDTRIQAANWTTDLE